MPGQLVKGLPFDIRFAGDDRLMFLPRDGSLFFETHFGPLSLWYNRPRQPRHVEGEVMDAAQKNVRGDPTAAQRVKEMFGPGFDDRQVANGIEGFVVHGTEPAFMRGASVELSHLIHDKLPVPSGDLWIGSREISAGDLQIGGGLPFGFILRMAHSKGGS